METIIKKLKKEIGDSITWWVKGNTVYFEGKTGKLTEAYKEDFENDFYGTLKAIKGEL